MFVAPGWGPGYYDNLTYAKVSFNSSSNSISPSRFGRTESSLILFPSAMTETKMPSLALIKLHSTGIPTIPSKRAFAIWLKICLVMMLSFLVRNRPDALDSILNPDANIGISFE